MKLTKEMQKGNFKINTKYYKLCECQAIADIAAVFWIREGEVIHDGARYGGNDALHIDKKYCVEVDVVWNEKFGRLMNVAKLKDGTWVYVVLE